MGKEKRENGDGDRGLSRLAESGKVHGQRSSGQSAKKGLVLDMKSRNGRRKKGRNGRGLWKTAI